MTSNGQDTYLRDALGIARRLEGRLLLVRGSYNVSHQESRQIVDLLEDALDQCSRCGGDHDRIDRREPCPERDAR